MTLRELVNLSTQFLREHPEAAEVKVLTEGCDCYGDAKGIELREKTQWLDSPFQVVITREE